MAGIGRLEFAVEGERKSTAESPKVSPALTLEEWKAMHHGSIVAKNLRKPKAIPHMQVGLPFWMISPGFTQG